MAAKINKLTDLKPDPNNFNKHTQFGMGLLEKSMREHGFMEAGVISEDGVIISGNARQEVAASIGLEDVQIVDTDGKKAIYIRAKGIKSGTKEFHELALKLNATAKANIEWDIPQLEMAIQEFDLQPLDWGVYIESEPTGDDLIGEAKDKAPTMKITFPTTKDLSDTEMEIRDLLGKVCPKAFYSVSAGEI